MDRPEARGQPLPRPGPSSQAPPGILSRPGRGGGVQPVLSDQQHISSFNPSNSPVRFFCSLTITLSGNSHTTGAGGCHVTGSAPRPWPQSGPPTNIRHVTPPVLQVQLTHRGSVTAGHTAGKRRGGAPPNDAAPHAPSLSAHSCLDPTCSSARHAAGCWGEPQPSALSWAAVHFLAAGREWVPSLGSASGFSPGSGGTLTLPRDMGARILGLSCQPPCVPPLPGRPPG